MIFPFKEKKFPHKSLYSCVVMLPLCLLKFIHNYIEFFRQKQFGQLGGRGKGVLNSQAQSMI